jgi:homoserine kinase
MDEKHSDAVKNAMAKAYAEEGIRAEVKVASVAGGALENI